jgi:hypothetical protein
MKITKTGTVTIETRDGKPYLIIEGFEGDFKGDTSTESPLGRVGIYAIQWAIDALNASIRPNGASQTAAPKTENLNP